MAKEKEEIKKEEQPKKFRFNEVNKGKEVKIDTSKDPKVG